MDRELLRYLLKSFPADDRRRPPRRRREERLVIRGYALPREQVEDEHLLAELARLQPGAWRQGSGISDPC